MVTKILEELTRHQLWEELHLWNQPVSGSKEQLQQRLTSSLEKEVLDLATETFEVDAKSTPDPLTQILELSAADYNHATSDTKCNILVLGTKNERTFKVEL